VDTDHTEADAFFDNNRIDDLVASHVTIFGAAAEGWRQRAGYEFDSIDIMENGSDRKLSQYFKHCMAMADYYDKRCATEEDEEMSQNRVVGKSFETGSDDCLDEDGLNPLWFPYPVQRGPVVM
jgi:hypothetical protein